MSRQLDPRLDISAPHRTFLGLPLRGVSARTRPGVKPRYLTLEHTRSASANKGAN
jgi:hypothetical protein